MQEASVFSSSISFSPFLNTEQRARRRALKQDRPDFNVFAETKREIFKKFRNVLLNWEEKKGN